MLHNLIDALHFLQVLFLCKRGFSRVKPKQWKLLLSIIAEQCRQSHTEAIGDIKTVKQEAILLRLASFWRYRAAASSFCSMQLPRPPLHCKIPLILACRGQ